MHKLKLLMPALVAGSLLAQATQDPVSERSGGSTLLLERGAHHNVLGLVETNQLESGETVVTTNRIVQVATGLNFLGEGRQFQPSVPEFELIDGAAIAWKGQHKVTVGWNVNSADAVQLRLPDGDLLTSQVHGLAYYDPATGQAVLIAPVKDSQGVLAAPNQVLFPDAFSGVSADVRYTYTLSGFEQDIILRESPPAPETFGLTSAVRMEVWTEFPQVPPAVVNAKPVGVEHAADEAAPLVDESVDFGSLQLGTGRAFAVEDAETPVAIVAKQWVETEGRHFLVETVAVKELQPSLERLPASGGGAAVKSRGGASRLQALRSLPAKAKTTVKGRGIRRLEPEKQVAMTQQPGLVLDWIGLNSTHTNWVFRGDDTYWLVAPLNLYGTNTLFEAGAILKFTNNVNGLKLTVNTPLTWGGSQYRPVILTAQSDHSVGQKIGTGTLTNYYAEVALCLDATTNVVTNFQLSHLRIAHAKTAIELKQKSGHVLSHVQLVNCETGIAPTSADFSLRNALFHNVLTNFNGSSSTGRVEHLTVNGGTWFHHGSTFNQLYVTNSLLVDVSNTGTLVNTNQVAILTGAGSVFTTALAGSNYLAAASPYRNAGTTAIAPSLALDFTRTTTYPPVQLTSNFSTNTALSPIIARDTDLPDLGYHYPALDYYWTSLTANNVNLTLLNGVAIGAYGPKLLTLSGTGRLSSTGLPQELNRLASYHTVQEQPQMWITNNTFTLINGSKVDLRFTDVALMTGSPQLMPDAFGDSVTIKDSQLRGVVWSPYNYTGSGYMYHTVTLQNNVLERCTLTFSQGYWATSQNYYLALTARNNLFSRCALTLRRSQGYYGTWAVHDNLFDEGSHSLAYFPTYDALDTLEYNGFINVSNGLGGANNKTSLLRDFVTGPLGAYYYPASGTTDSLASLINADAGRTAAGVGLAPYAVTQDQAKDTGNLDIGFHYVATDSYSASGGYSGTQGLNGWYYQYAPMLSLTTTNLPTYGTALSPNWTNIWYNSAWAGTTNEFCWVYNVGQIPGGTVDSVRTFRLPKAGRALVTGSATDGQTTCTNTDGASLAIGLNGAWLAPRVSLPEGATTPMTTATRVNEGDLLSFSVNKLLAMSCDLILWDPRISLDTPTDSDGDGLPDWFEDSNGDGSQNASDGGGDTDGDGVIDRLDARPFDPSLSTFSLFIDSPVNGSTINY